MADVHAVYIREKMTRILQQNSTNQLIVELTVVEHDFCNVLTDAEQIFSDVCSFALHKRWSSVREQN